MSGFCECLDCGEVFNRADLVAGLCAECTRRRIAYLAAFRQDYQEALDRGDIAASVRIAGLIKAFPGPSGAFYASDVKRYSERATGLSCVVLA